MRKRFLNAVLFATAFATATGTLVSCKDYDDDIASLQEQINQKATAADLTAQLATLQNDLASTKSSLNTQLETLKKEIADAAKGQDEATAELIKAIETKLAAIADAEKKINGLADELKKANEKQLADLEKKVAAATGDVAAIVGQRLTSLVFTPDTYIDGIEAIKFTTLEYENWSSLKISAPNTDKEYSIDNGATEVNYRVSPSVIKESSIESLEFLWNDAEHYVYESRAVKTSPLTVVGKTLKDGAMTVKVKKNWTDSFGQDRDNFTIVALKAKTVLGENEKGADPYVYSDWARLWEESLVPILDNKELKNHTGKGEFDYLTSRDEDEAGKHFWNFGTVYPTKEELGWTKEKPNTTDSEKYIAATVVYNQTLDLRTLVQVCTFNANKTKTVKGKEVRDITLGGTLTDEILKDPASYGLTVEFALTDYWYKNLKDTKDATNQKKFAAIDKDGYTLHSSAENGLLDNADAVGRTPVVQAVLKNGDKVVDVVYFKIQWSATAPSTQIMDNGNLPNVAYVCAPDAYKTWLGEEFMNNIYAKVVAGGMSRDQFHAAYPNLMNKKAYEKNDVDAKAEGLGDLYLGDAVKDAEAIKAAVAAGDMKGYQVIGTANDLSDKAELTQTHNVEFTVAAETINPKAEADFSKEAFFVYVSADGNSKVIVPVTINVKAGKYSTVYNYLAPQWEGALEVTPNVADVAKARPINPTLFSDKTYGNDTYGTTQLIGNLAYGYMYKNEMPKSILELIQYTPWNVEKNAWGEAKTTASDILFDKDRLNTMAYKDGAKKGQKVAGTWVLSVDEKTLYLKTSKTDSIAAAEIVGNNVYLIDNQAATGTTGEDNAQPTTAALQLVGATVPVKVVAEHCEWTVYDRYDIRYITPLEIVVKEGGLELKDVLNTGDAAAVGLADQYSLKEAFGSHSPIYLFSDAKKKIERSTVLINWYEIKNVLVDLDNALINLDENGNMVDNFDAVVASLTEKTKPNYMLNKKLNNDDEQAYVLYVVDKDKVELGKTSAEAKANAENVWGLKFHNNSGQAITKDLIIKLPVSMDTKWQKDLKDNYITVTIHPNL